MSKTIEDIYKELKNEFSNTKGGKEILKESGEIAKSILKDLAKIKFYAISADESKKESCEIIAKMYKESLKDIKLATFDKAKNYAIERIEKFVEDVAIKYSIKLLL